MTQYDDDDTYSDSWAVPIIIVNGLKDDSTIKLYLILEMSSSEEGTLYIDEGEFEFSLDKNYYRNASIRYWGSVYHCDGKLYLFNDYDTYLDHDFEKAIATGSIKYSGK